MVTSGRCDQKQKGGYMGKQADISICHKGDVVVSQDYGVATMALGKGLARSGGPWP